MKVFNWVHRRFLHIHSDVTSLQDDKERERNGKSKVDVETHALLHHDDGHLMMDMIKDWKEGILAIGTLAIGPLDRDDDDDDDDDVNQDDDTNNYVHVDDADDGYDDDDIESSPLMKMTLFSHELEKMEIGEEIKKFDDDTKECQIKRRVTLADLFLEDNVKETKGSSTYVTNHTHYFPNGKSNLKMKPPSSTNYSPPKNGLSKAKKILKDELRPIKKLNQLMKRMMKKKVHPDMVEGENGKDNGMMPSNEINGPSLLLLQDSEA